MTWLVIGGTSGIGAQVVYQAADRGFAVRAFGRSAAERDFPANVDAYVGDALNNNNIAAALEGIDVVVQALGVRERPAMLWETETLFSSATQLLIPAMQASGARRLITVTGYGAGDSKSTMSKPARLAHNAVLGRVYDDKTRQEAIIEASDLEWTIVRPTLLTSGSLSKRYKVLSNPQSWRLGMISRADVAHFIINCARDVLHVKEAVVLA
ncbi:MAG: NAD(P)-binding oxidoreductase [Pseudomonadota bacterium]